MQKTAFSILRDNEDDDDGGSIFYSSPTQMAIKVFDCSFPPFLLYMFLFLIKFLHQMLTGIA